MRVLHVSLFLLPLAACQGFISGEGDDPKGKPVDQAPNTDVNPTDHPPLDAPITSAGNRRLSVEQLRRSLPVVFGNDESGSPITWKIGSKNGLDDNSDTLGEADYINTTEDNLEPSPLYLKFVDDAARDVCNRRLTADLAEADGDKRVLYAKVQTTDTSASAGSAVDANLRHLALRFWGVKLADSDTTSTAGLHQLFDKAVESAAAGKTPTEAHVKEGWRAVCVALVTAPEFHIY
jgi:hypothetical protein